jgi:hypothetical protein
MHHCIIGIEISWIMKNFVLSLKLYNCSKLMYLHWFPSPTCNRSFGTIAEVWTFEVPFCLHVQHGSGCWRICSHSYSSWIMKLTIILYNIEPEWRVHGTINVKSDIVTLLYLLCIVLVSMFRILQALLRHLLSISFMVNACM